MVKLKFRQTAYNGESVLFTCNTIIKDYNILIRGEDIVTYSLGICQYLYTTSFQEAVRICNEDYEKLFNEIKKEYDEYFVKE